MATEQQVKYGWFTNRQGYKLVKLGTVINPAGDKAAEYDFTLDPVAPLTYHDGRGGKYQPNRHYTRQAKDDTTDMGSIPKCLQWLIAKDKYLLAFIYHDSAWEHEGVWYCPPGYEHYIFQRMTLYESNAMLQRMVVADAAGDPLIGFREAQRDAWLIKKAVDLAAMWRQIRRRKPRYPR